MIRIYLILFFAFKSFFINALDKDSCRNNIFLNSNLVFYPSIIQKNISNQNSNILKDSLIRSTIGINHTVYINGHSSAIGGGIGLEFFKIEKLFLATVPVFLSTKLGTKSSPLNLYLKAGTFLSAYNFKKNFFYDLGFQTKPLINDFYLLALIIEESITNTKTIELLILTISYLV